MAVEISLTGRVAMVTGASRMAGIGAAVARLLARAGAEIFLTYYTPYDRSMAWGIGEHEPAALVDELRGLGVRAAAIEADLSDPTVPARLFDQVEAGLGPVDFLINNAAYDVETSIYELTADLLDLHYAVNVRGTALLCAEFARRYKNRTESRTGGRIVNLVSGELLAPMVGNLPYAVTKGAIDGLTITLSGELADQGITVNAVDPGATDTGWMTKEVKERHANNAPFGRTGQPQDAAHLILFLVSDLGGWITGQIIHSRGGF